MMDETRYRYAALACFASALLGAALLPSFTHTESEVLQIGIPIVSLALYIYIMLSFRHLLATRLQYTGANATIALLIAGFSSLVTASVLDEFGTVFLPLSTVLVVGGAVLAGIGCIVLGIQLIRLMKALRWTGLALTVLLVLEGFFFVTVVWIAVGIVVAIPAELVLGLVFFRYTRHHDAPLRANAVA